MHPPLTQVLLKIFARGFYRVHAGILLVLFLALFGLVEPGQVLNYHKVLMLAFITSPVMMAVVFALWLIYYLKTLHYTAGQLFNPQQQFLFYSSTSYKKTTQFISWATLQITVSLPLLLYAAFSIAVAIGYHYYLQALVIVAYLAIITALSAWFYTVLVNRSVDGNQTGMLLRFTSQWKKPYYSLYIFHVMDKLKLTWLITKGLSYLIINAVFLLFADVSHDVRVAGIAVLAVAVSHSIIVFNERQFEETYLSFTRNLPYTRFKLFLGFALVYTALLLPEAIWLFTRFNPIMACALLAFGLSVIVLFHSLLYRLGLNMEKYMQWVPALFVVLFWAILFKLLWLVALFNFCLAFWLFYRNYYKVNTTISIKE
jgi:hypothetical protein